MEENKIVYLAAIIVIILLILLGVAVFFYLKILNINEPITNQGISTTNTSGPTPFLPISDLTNQNLGNGTSGPISLEKEKQFVSSFYEPIQIIYQAQTPSFELPLPAIKEQITNYRDFSRKINLDSILEKISNNGFIIINDPFTTEISDWSSSYRQIKDNELPILITADSVVGLYQDSFQIIYKEIEQEIFYPSLWELLEKMFDKAKKRYEARRNQFGIETETITEADRLELAYLTVALKLLEPQTKQIRESLSADKKFFSAQEAENYKINVPDYLTKEVNQEINLITTKAKEAKSPILLYQKSYSQYGIPAHYQTSEKLKNYYLTITWLNDAFFPLWAKENDCPDCLLDQDDHLINFLASLYLSNDLASDQNLKNQWANIYKSISFFRGLETNLTYLDYDLALKDLFGQNYELDEVFNTSPEEIKETINQIQEKISSYEFSEVLGGTPKETKEKAGLRLLRSYYLLENKLFETLTEPKTGKYLEPIEKNEIIPFTACQKDKNIYRCIPTALDLFHLLENKMAEMILSDTKNNRFELYQNNLNDFTEKVRKFNQSTWHDNSYLALLSALVNLNDEKGEGFPSFMQTDAWAEKSLNTSIAAWVNNHREISLEKTENFESGGLVSYFPYGYIEPQPELYSQLLANVEMVINGFATLKIITPIDKSFERLENLKIILQKVTAVSRKELENGALAEDDYNFINNFDKQIKGVTSDIKKESLQNNYQFNFLGEDKNLLSESIDGFNYLIIIYPDSEGKLFFALGPVLNSLESKNGKKTIFDWQKDIRQ